jgi:hypothetical protein
MKKIRKRKTESRKRTRRKPMSNKKETLTPAEEEEQAFLAKQVKEPLHHPKKNAGDPAAAGPATADGSEQYAGEDFLPPPDPPVVPSFPKPPATGYEVDNQQKGAQPEATAVREMELLQVGTRGEGPAPEPPVEIDPPPEGKKS